MIRKAKISDKEAIFNIFSETKTPWSISGIEESIAKDEFFLFDEGEVFGAIALSRVTDEGEVLNFAVKEQERGKKIGERLLSFSVSELQKEGIKSLYLDVRESNSPAISLYKKMGFEEIGIRKRFYENPCENALLMVLYIK